ncbi:MAG: phytanoyl-CoA dioxygenase family protein [Chitinophagaceae bacterium]
MAYNFFHKKELIHNVAVYKKLGISKKYYASVSSKDFEHIKEKNLPIHNFENKIKSTSIFLSATVDTKQSILDYEKEGYIVLKNYFQKNQMDDAIAEVNRLLQENKIEYKKTNRIMFAIHKSTLLRQLGEDKALRELLDILIGGKAKLFQSINFTMGSEQDTHSDSIHMTTFPLGGLLGVWIALEDIEEDNGPLHYYPKSHKLPYYLNSDYDNEGNALMLGKKDYDEYENMIAEKLKSQQLEKKIFTAKKGDVLIWHANLLHGGEPHSNKSKTRNSMVFHFYNPNCVCYHEITQRPALMPL